VPLIVETMPVGLLQTNCYLAACEETREAVIVDPGGHPERILGAVQKNRLRVRYVLNTHGHFDHTEANAAIVAATGAPLAAHPLERPLLAMAGGAGYFGLPARPGPAPSRDLVPGEELAVGTLRFQVLYTPGHTPGHVCFYERDQGVLFDGDVLFYQGIGRADLPGGNPQQLIRSIRAVLYALPDETLVYPGHGPATTIGDEKRYNPFVRGRDED
jgi:glyoxylase-like metal-dependent hydrolase (beta-lactamase superfamily II)